MTALALPRPLSRSDTPARIGLMEVADPGQTLDRITRLASRSMDAPMAMLCLGDQQSLVVKSAIGLPDMWAKNQDLSLGGAVWLGAMQTGKPLVLTDAKQSTATGTSATLEGWGIASCLSVPIQLPSGVSVGTLCVMQTRPRMWTQVDIDTLSDLATWAAAELGLAAKGIDPSAPTARVKELESQKLELETRMRHHHKLAMLGTLVHGVAHDFRNLVSAMLGYAELARLDCEGNPAAQENLADLLRAIQQAKSRIQQTLILGSSPESRCTRLRLSKALDEWACLMRAILPARITLEVNAASSLPMVWADPAQLQQVVMSLVMNAAQSIGLRKGCVKLNLQTVSIAQDDQHGSEGLPRGIYACISIQDSGEGMDQGTLDRIFEPFFTTKSAERAAGLGLPLALEIVKNHSGTIRVESSLGFGTTVNVFLPEHIETEPWLSTQEQTR